MKGALISCALILFCAAQAVAEPLRVVALHPLMADLARQVGGDRVQVHDVVSEGSNPHRFEPRPEDMQQMRDASLILAAGMGLEPYLGRLRDTLGAEKVLEVGKTLPALTVCGDGACSGHHHHEGNTDPHWWHSIDHMSRASRILAESFSALDPAGSAIYQKQAADYRKKLVGLKRWARLELAAIPASRRQLATAHQAFGYFAAEFEFTAIAIAGLNAEQGTAPRDLAATIEDVRNLHVSTLFPEQFASRKVLESVCKETGTRMGEALVADGNGSGDAAGFEGMIRHNVRAITQALATP